MRTRGTSLVRQLEKEKHRQQFQESLGFSCTLPATGWQWPLRGQTLLVNPSELGSVSSFKTTRFSYYDWTIYQFHPKWWNPKHFNHITSCYNVQFQIQLLAWPIRKPLAKILRPFRRRRAWRLRLWTSPVEVWVTGKLGDWEAPKSWYPKSWMVYFKRQKTWMTGGMTGGTYHDLGNLQLRPWFHRFLSLCTSGIRDGFSNFGTDL